MPMCIEEPDARVLHSVRCFFQRLEQMGYGEFSTENLEKWSELLRWRLFPTKLQEVIETKF